MQSALIGALTGTRHDAIVRLQWMPKHVGRLFRP